MLRGTLLALMVLAPMLFVASSTGATAPWWESTTLDVDGDGIDDALMASLAGTDPLVVLVDYAGVPTAAQRDAVVAGFELVAAYDHFDVLAVRVLPSQITSLLQLPGVVFIERNDDIDRQLKESVPLIGAPQVWKTYKATGKGVVVAVLDDGAFEQHPDLRAKVAGSYDAATTSGIGPFAVPASIPVVPAGDEGHGTHVAGTIVGAGDQSGGAYKGVAPDATFVDVKVFSGPNSTSSDIVLRGLDWVLSNAPRLDIRVASMSLGGRASDGNDALSRAVNVAVDKGLIVVASAGNTGPGSGTVSSPGAAEKAITVGAVDKQKKLAPYSSRGPLLNGRIKPDLVAPGTEITSTVPPTSTAIVGGLLRTRASPTIYYAALSGTSMAAPHVSGVIALMLQVNPDLTPFEVKQILIATAQDLGTKGLDPETGYGFVNAIAATQVALDPTLLDTPQFASTLRTLPEPPEESFITRAQAEIQAAQRQGLLPIYGGIAFLILALIVLVVALIVRRKR